MAQYGDLMADARDGIVKKLMAAGVTPEAAPKMEMAESEEMVEEAMPDGGMQEEMMQSEEVMEEPGVLADVSSMLTEAMMKAEQMNDKEAFTKISAMKKMMMGK